MLAGAQVDGDLRQLIESCRRCVCGSVHRGWRDALRTKRGGIGICHCDLNCHNILTKLIDFASVLLEDSSARDWAKLERDIKLRCLRDFVEVRSEYVETLKQVEAVCR